MSRNESKNIEALAELFKGSASVVAVQLPLRDRSLSSSDKSPILRGAVHQSASQYIGHNCIVVSGTDGFLLVSDSVDESQLNSNLDALKDDIRSNLKTAGLCDALVYENIVVNKLANQFKVNENATMDHQGFIELEHHERITRINNLVSTTNVSDMVMQPFLNVHDQGEISRLLTYRLIPYSKPSMYSHRDDYYEPNPSCAVIDVALIREAVRLKLEELESGEDLPIIVPVNAANLLDKRYYPLYEVEFRNIPGLIKRMIGLQLVRVSPGMPASRLSDALTRMQTFADYIYLCVSIDWAPMGTPFFVGFSGIGTAIPHTLRQKDQVKELNLKMSRLMPHIRPIAIPFFIQNVSQSNFQEMSRLYHPDFVVPDLRWAQEYYGKSQQISVA